MHIERVLPGGSVSEGGSLRSLILDSCTSITSKGILGLSRFQSLRVLSVAFMESLRDADLLYICEAHPKLEVWCFHEVHAMNLNAK